MIRPVGRRWVWPGLQDQDRDESGMHDRLEATLHSWQGQGTCVDETLSTNVLDTPPPPHPLHIFCCCGKLSGLLTFPSTPPPTPATPPLADMAAWKTTTLTHTHTHIQIPNNKLKEQPQTTTHKTTTPAYHHNGL